MERKGLAAAAQRTSLVSLVVEIVMMIQSALRTSYVVTTTAGTFTPMQAQHMIVAKLDQLMGVGQNGPPGQDAQRRDPGNAPDQLQKMVGMNALDQKRRSRL